MLGQLQTLTELNLRLCGLKVVPVQLLSGLTALQRLTLSDNPTSSLSDQEWSGLASLQLLDVTGCSDLVALPAELQSCTALAELQLAGCTRILSLSGLSAQTKTKSGLNVWAWGGQPPLFKQWEAAGRTKFPKDAK